jgi:ABC-2 type transport system ATP-binding protein
MPETILEVKGLTRVYSPFLYRAGKALKIKALQTKFEPKVLTAVNNISFSLEAGEICGFLGPNGAGKSTTIKSIMGLIAYNSGEINICGIDQKKNRTKVLLYVGGVIEMPVLYKNLSGEENLKYFAALRGIKDKEIIETTLKTVDLYDRRLDKFGVYSMGMRQRLGIAQAILHKPKLLILDEPANGLDPQGVIDLRKMLKKLAHEEGMAILVSSHQLSEMQQLCDRVIIMNKGELIADKNIEDLSISGEQKVSVQFNTLKPEEAARILREKYGAECSADKDKVEAALSKDQVPEATKELLLAGVDISGVKIKEFTLEDLFVQMTGGDSK